MGRQPPTEWDVLLPHDCGRVCAEEEGHIDTMKDAASHRPMKMAAPILFLFFISLLSLCCHISINEPEMVTRQYLKSVEWNPNNRSLALLKDEYSYSPDPPFVFREHYFDIFLTGFDGKLLRQLTAVRNKQLEKLKWSQTGSQVLYMNFGPAFEIGVVDTLGNTTYHNDSSFVDF